MRISNLNMNTNFTSLQITGWKDMTEIQQLLTKQFCSNAKRYNTVSELENCGYGRYDIILQPKGIEKISVHFENNGIPLVGKKHIVKLDIRPSAFSKGFHSFLDCKYNIINGTYIKDYSIKF